MACQGRYMIVCDHFVFLHLHKSGGTFVNQLMLKCMPSARRLGYHLPYAELPAEYRDLPIVGTVRNPWAYYVSWFFFQQAQARPNALFQICSEQGSLGFAETITNLVNLHDDDERIDRLIAAFPDAYVGHGLNLTKTCIASIRGSGLGFYSFLYARLYEGAHQARIIPAESLRAGLRDVLKFDDQQERERVNYFLDAAPDLNTSSHAPFATYYDAALSALVRERERPVIDGHDYPADPMTSNKGSA